VLQTINVEQLVTPIPEGMQHEAYVYMKDDVGLAAEMMGKYNRENLLVLDNKANRKSVGIITNTAILKYYSDQKQREHIYNSPARTRKLMVQGRKFIRKMRNAY